MDYNTLDKIIESFGKHPVRTGLVIILMVAIAVTTLFLTGYLGEVGKKAAIGKDTKQTAQTTPAGIKQETKGDQSPAVISGGDVNITFEDKKDN